MARLAQPPSLSKSADGASSHQFSPGRFGYIDALRYLKTERNALLIPVGEDKAPTEGFRRWRDSHSWSWDELEVHAQRADLFALVPGSLDLSVLDWDSEDLEAAAGFTAEHPALAYYPTRRAGGLHFYYADPTPRRTCKWSYRDAVRGECISSFGYAVLWGSGPQILAETLLQGPPVQGKFPDHLLADGAGIQWAPADTSRAEPPPEAARTFTPQLDASAVQWETVRPKYRNDVLFKALTAYAKSAPAHDFADFASWLQVLTKLALSWRARMPDTQSHGGFSEIEAASTARSVAHHWWGDLESRWKRHYRKADSETQAARGRKSGQARRKGRAARDAEIVRLRDEELLTQEQIAERVGVSVRTVRGDLARLRASTKVRRQPADT